MDPLQSLQLFLDNITNHPEQFTPIHIILELKSYREYFIQNDEIVQEIDTRLHYYYQLVRNDAENLETHMRTLLNNPRELLFSIGDIIVQLNIYKEACHDLQDVIAYIDEQLRFLVPFHEHIMKYDALIIRIKEIITYIDNASLEILGGEFERLLYSYNEIITIRTTITNDRAIPEWIRSEIVKRIFDLESAINTYIRFFTIRMKVIALAEGSTGDVIIYMNKLHEELQALLILKTELRRAGMAEETDIMKAIHELESHIVASLKDHLWEKKALFHDHVNRLGAGFKDNCDTIERELNSGEGVPVANIVQYIEFLDHLLLQNQLQPPSSISQEIDLKYSFLRQRLWEYNHSLPDEVRARDFPSPDLILEKAIFFQHMLPFDDYALLKEIDERIQSRSFDLAFLEHGLRFYRYLLDGIETIKMSFGSSTDPLQKVFVKDLYISQALIDSVRLDIFIMIRNIEFLMNDSPEMEEKITTIEEYQRNAIVEQEIESEKSHIVEQEIIQYIDIPEDDEYTIMENVSKVIYGEQVVDQILAFHSNIYKDIRDRFTTVEGIHHWINKIRGDYPLIDKFLSTEALKDPAKSSGGQGPIEHTLGKAYIRLLPDPANVVRIVFDEGIGEYIESLKKDHYLHMFLRSEGSKDLEITILQNLYNKQYVKSDGLYYIHKKILEEKQTEYPYLNTPPTVTITESENRFLHGEYHALNVVVKLQRIDQKMYAMMDIYKPKYQLFYRLAQWAIYLFQIWQRTDIQRLYDMVRLFMTDKYYVQETIRDSGGALNISEMVVIFNVIFCMINYVCKKTHNTVCDWLLRGGDMTRVETIRVIDRDDASHQKTLLQAERTPSMIKDLLFMTLCGIVPAESQDPVIFLYYNNALGRYEKSVTYSARVEGTLKRQHEIKESFQETLALNLDTVPNRIIFDAETIRDCVKYDKTKIRTHPESIIDNDCYLNVTTPDGVAIILPRRVINKQQCTYWETSYHTLWKYRKFMITILCRFVQIKYLPVLIILMGLLDFLSPYVSPLLETGFNLMKHISLSVAKQADHFAHYGYLPHATSGGRHRPVTLFTKRHRPSNPRRSSRRQALFPRRSSAPHLRSRHHRGGRIRHLSSTSSRNPRNTKRKASLLLS